MIKSRYVAVGLLLMLIVSLAGADPLGNCPNLPELINKADAIVILRIDREYNVGIIASLYSTYDCFIYQTLKGDIPKDTRIKLQLYSAEYSLFPSYPLRSCLLVFLMKKIDESEATDYRTLPCIGVHVLLSPLGREKIPEGATIEEQVRNLIKGAIAYQTEEYWKNHRFLSNMLNYKEDANNHLDDYDGEIEDPPLVWRDSQTKKVIFTSDDIISFDWEKQIFSLKLDATIDFLAWVSSPQAQIRGLYVDDAEGTIYQACCASIISSIGFSGPAYEPFSPNPVFSIKNGYPGKPKSENGINDLRFAQRLKDGLDKAKKLGTIDLEGEHTSPSIKTIGHGWEDVGEDLGVRLDYFEDTFMIDRLARAHLHFSGGEKTKRNIDSLFCIIILTANDGAFRSETIMDAIPISEIEDGFYECKFDPYQPEVGSDAKIKSYGGLVSLAVVFHKKGHIVYRLDFPEKTVAIKGTN